MTKTIRLEVEVTLDESVEQRAIKLARKHYREVGQATAPPDDKGDRWREIPAEEFIPDLEAAIMELIGTNDLLEKAGAEVTAVSGFESHRQELPSQETRDPGLQDGAGLTDLAGGGGDADLDEFETGAYLCRWPNGDRSLRQTRVEKRLSSLTSGQEPIRPNCSRLIPAWWTSG